ncbi:MAG: hypothetical protein KJ601_05015 [Nanoarchaeota archaeon]|nr:hypothetical protein [Nanoarchaeota archaeon]
MKYLKLYKDINFNRFLYTLFCDFVFLLVLYTLGQYFTPYIKDIAPIKPVVVVALVLLYYLIMILAYSAVKFVIVHLITDKKISFKGGGKFFLANLVTILAVSVGSLIVFTALNLMFIANFFKWIAAAYILAFLFFFYPYFNYMHFFFVKGKRYNKKALALVKHVGRYARAYGWSILLILLFFVVMGLITLIFKDNLVYATINKIITAVFFYCLLAYNRYYLYSVVKEEN